METAQQGLIFIEAEVLAGLPESGDSVADSEAQAGQIEVKALTKARGHPKPLLWNLPREIVKIELPEAERFADDGTPVKIIGYEFSEKLKYEPGKITVLEIRAAKYGIDAGEYVKTAYRITGWRRYSPGKALSSEGRRWHGWRIIKTARLQHAREAKI